MLSRTNRLTGDKNFQRVKSQGKVFQSDSFGLAFFERGDALPSKFGFVVSNKISKKATERNKIKRAMREAVRGVVEKTKLGYDIVFLVKQRLVLKENSGIGEEIKEALVKSGLTK